MQKKYMLDDYFSDFTSEQEEDRKQLLDEDNIDIQKNYLGDSEHNDGVHKQDSFIDFLF